MTRGYAAHVSSLKFVDRTAHAPAGVRRRTRRPDEVRVLALHQMACAGSWDEDSPAWDRVSAHLIVRRSGVVQVNHDPLERITVGSGPRWNPSCVTVEFAGNLPIKRARDGSWRWWKPERFGRDLLTPEQVEAGRELVAWLRSRLPALAEVGPHRLVDPRKGGCCGPHAWAEVGAWAIAEGGMRLARTDGGLDIPADWWGPRGAPGATVGGRAGAASGGAGEDARTAQEASPFASGVPRRP